MIETRRGEVIARPVDEMGVEGFSENRHLKILLRKVAGLSTGLLRWGLGEDVDGGCLAHPAGRHVADEVLLKRLEPGLWARGVRQKD